MGAAHSLSLMVLADPALILPLGKNCNLFVSFVWFLFNDQVEPKSHPRLSGLRCDTKPFQWTEKKEKNIKLS